MQNPTTPIKTVQRATATLPQTTQHALFTVSGGRIKIIDIVGEVTVEIGAGANNAKLISNPTVGADVDLCAQVDIDGDVVGTLYSISGTLADAMVPTISGAFKAQASSQVVAVGTIDLYCDASKAGSVKWTLRYEKLDREAVVVAT